MMKATGLVRRIDELGRIVIPKELRRQYKIHEGDPLEIFVDDNGEVVLKKYSAIQDMETLSTEYARSLNESTGHNVLITDTDRIIGVSDGLENLIDTSVSGVIEEAIRTKKSVLLEEGQPADISPDIEGVKSILASPIFTIDRDVIGAIVLYSPNTVLGEFEKKIIETAGNFLGKQVDLG